MDFELLTISNSGYPGYFLIVQDFIAKAREMDVCGSGRGSAAGSAVAYCLKLLILILSNTICFFERFLNPIVSMPDIDIDF
jgi:DNA polymerase-3 subunit alpha